MIADDEKLNADGDIITGPARLEYAGAPIDIEAALAELVAEYMAPGRPGKIRSRATKNKGQGQTKARRQMAKKSRRQNRGKL